MVPPTESNEPLSAEEQDAFRKKAAHNQFLSALFQGIGGALLFGFVSSLVIGSGLTGGGIAALGTVGLVGIPLIGIASIFIGTRFSLEAQLLSQKLSAKLMGSVIGKKDGPAPELTPEPTHERPQTLPPGMDHGRTQDKQNQQHASEKVPGSKVHHIALAAPLQESELARA